MKTCSSLVGCALLLLASGGSIAAPPDQKSARPLVVLNAGLKDTDWIGVNPDGKAMVNIGMALMKSLEDKITASPTFRLVPDTMTAPRLLLATNSIHSNHNGKNEDTISYSVLLLFENPATRSAGHSLSAAGFIGMDVDAFVIDSKTVGKEAHQKTDEIAEKILAVVDKRMPFAK